jgi:uncharacterized protein
VEGLLEWVVDETPLVELSEHECYLFLARARFGRVAFVDTNRAIVLPVNYVFDRPDVVFRTTIGTKLRQAEQRAPASFEVDAIDPLYHGGWSVLAHGRLEVISGAEELRRVESLPLRSWWQRAQDRWVRLRVTEVSGRRLRQPL